MDELKNKIENDESVNEETDFDEFENRVMDKEPEIAAIDDLEPEIVNDNRLSKLIDKAKELTKGTDDTKFKCLQSQLKKLLEDGFRPVVFCRYIATVQYLTDRLQNMKVKTKGILELQVNIIATLHHQLEDIQTYLFIE